MSATKCSSCIWKLYNVYKNADMCRREMKKEQRKPKTSWTAKNRIKTRKRVEQTKQKKTGFFLEISPLYWFKIILAGPQSQPQEARCKGLVRWILFNAREHPNDGASLKALRVESARVGVAGFSVSICFCFQIFVLKLKHRSEFQTNSYSAYITKMFT